MNKSKTTNLSKKNRSTKNITQLPKQTQFQETKPSFQVSLTNEYIKLKSNNGYVYYIPKKVGEGSFKIKQMLKEHLLSKTKQGEVGKSTKKLTYVLPKEIKQKEESEIVLNSQVDEEMFSLQLECNHKIVEIFVDYLNYKYYYENVNIPDDMNTLKKFDFNSDYGLDLLILSNEYGV